MILAGDVGGTKTLLGLFERDAPRPRAVVVRSYPTADFASFTAMLDAFSAGVGLAPGVEAAAAGVAGPVVGDRARLTNIPWNASVGEIAARLATTRVRLLNDLEALATSVEVLGGDEVERLQPGTRDPHGNAAVIAAGTGLGQAYLHRVNGRLWPAPSEAGHADFAARTDQELDLVRLVRSRFGRAEVEQVISGPGLVNIHALTHRGVACTALPDVTSPDAPALISQAALDGTCAACAAALGVFVEAYGAEAGNLALRAMATAGVYIGGGIAPKILPALRDGRFMRAFRDKAPMAELAARIPVTIILNAEAGLIGAAVAAQALLE